MGTVFGLEVRRVGRISVLGGVVVFEDKVEDSVDNVLHEGSSDHKF